MRQYAMETNHAGKIVLAIARHFQNYHAAEAVTDCGHLAQIGIGHFAQLIETAARSRPQKRSVRRVFHHLGFAGLRRVRADALAIDVDDKGVEPKLAEHLGALLGVFADTAPFRKHQNAGALGAGIVPDGKALTKVAVVLVFDDRRLLHLALPHRQLDSQKRCRSEKTVPITSCEIIPKQCHSANGPIGASVDGEPLVDTVSLRLDGTVPGYWNIRKTSVDTTPCHNDWSFAKPAAFVEP